MTETDAKEREKKKKSFVATERATDLSTNLNGGDVGIALQGQQHVKVLWRSMRDVENTRNNDDRGSMDGRRARTIIIIRKLAIIKSKP